MSIQPSVRKRWNKRFHYTKAEIEGVLAQLLVNEADLGRWHSPKGVFPHKNKKLLMTFSVSEFWVVNHLAKKRKLNLSDMLKWLLINYYFRIEVPQADILKETLSIKTREWLYGYAMRKIKREGGDEVVAKPRAQIRNKRGSKVV